MGAAQGWSPARRLWFGGASSPPDRKTCEATRWTRCVCRRSGRVTAWQAGLDRMTSWAFPTFHLDDWVHCFIFGFLSLSCSCGDWDLGQAFGIPFLIPVKSGFSYRVWEGEEAPPLWPEKVAQNIGEIPPPSEGGGLSSHPLSASSQDVMSFTHRLKPLLASLFEGFWNKYGGGEGET